MLTSSDEHTGTVAPGHSPDGLLVLNPHLTVHVCGPDEVLIKHGTRSRISTLVADRRGLGVLGRLLERFRVPADADAALEYIADPAIRAVATEFIESLRGRHFLVSASGSSQSAYAGLRFGPAASARLAALTISVLGDGELSRRLDQELGFLGCQVEHREAGSDSVVEGAEAVFEKSDHVVVALDRFAPPLLREVNEHALAVGRSWTSGYVDGSHAILGPTFEAGGRPCYVDVDTQLEAGFAMRAEYLTHLRALDQADPSAASLPPGVGSLAAGWLVVGLVPTLLGEPSTFDGRCVVVDLEGGAVDSVNILCLPRCPACSPGRVLTYH